jgi:threonine dehydratase
MSEKIIEYRVRQVMRHVITKYTSTENGAGSEVICELGNWEKAIDLAKKLAEVDGGVYIYPHQDECTLGGVQETPVGTK